MAMEEQQLHFNPAGTHVYVVHAETGGQWECPVDYLPTARIRGFEPCAPRDDSLDGLYDTTTEGEAQTGFDPSVHTVAEVNAHLEAHADQSPGEVERVLALEVAGKNRATVTDPRVIEDVDNTPGD